MNLMMSKKKDNQGMENYANVLKFSSRKKHLFLVSIVVQNRRKFPLKSNEFKFK